VEVARSGRLGRIHTVHTCLGAGPACGIEPPQPVPEGFDYDRWLGPAPAEPYTPRRCHGSFRWIFDYSGGKLTDIGAHFNDLAQWGIDMENTGPVEYDGSATFPEEGLWDTPMYYSVVCRYANGIRLVMHDVEPRSVRFEGPGGLPVFLNSPAVIVRSDAGLQDGRLDFTLRDMYAPATHTYLAPVAEPRSVTGAGERVSSSEAMLAAESAWLYDAELQGLILKHSMKGAEVACEILW